MLLLFRQTVSRLTMVTQTAIAVSSRLSTKGNHSTSVSGLDVAFAGVEQLRTMIVIRNGDFASVRNFEVWPCGWFKYGISER